MTVLKDATSDLVIEIYPNPNNGVFTVKSKGAVVYSIINEMGQIIREGKLSGENYYTVDIQDLSSGIYNVVGYKSNSISKQKIVVIR